ncbi:hypothetical protein K2X33_05300, partial [bacterium]|nr:hypothetical protein [bacterium]
DLLDQLTSGGTAVFGRVSPKRTVSATRGQKLTTVVPLSFGLRRDWSWICTSQEGDAALTERASSEAADVLGALQSGGAQFADDLESRTGLLSSQVRGALGELAAEGWITCDQFGAFRSFLATPKREKPRRVLGLSRRPGRSSVPLDAGGRWTCLKRGTVTPEAREAWVEHWASQLLLRYGIVFRNVLERETLAPSWGELVRVFRRWEARGEIRGGRFIAGVAGEQFGLAETHEALMKIRAERAEHKRGSSFTVISAADPLNLIGIVTRDAKIASSPSVKLLFQAGRLRAVNRGGDIETQADLSEPHLRALRLAGTVRNPIVRREAGQRALA